MKTKISFLINVKILKFSFAIVLVLGFLVNNNVIGQTVYTLGSGTSYSTTSGETAIRTTNHDSRAQYLIKASELTALGATMGSISQLQLYIYEKSGRDMSGFNIMIKHTTATTLDATFDDVSTFTTVYSANPLTKASLTAGAWKAFPFTSNFNWDGTSNLLIQICFDNSAWTTGGGVYVYTPGTYNACRYFSADSKTGCSLTDAATTSLIRPQMKLSITAASPVLNATALSSFGSVCQNTTAGPNSFTISGSYLTSANVTVGARAGFSYCTTSNGTYANSLSLTQPGGTYSQTIYVKFSPSAVQSYDGNIAIGGGGATSINVAAVGSGVNSPPTVTSGSASSITAYTATVAGTISATGCSSITAYGIEYSTSSGFANGAGTPISSTNLSGGNFSSNLTSLSGSTTYYYHAYATNSSGTSYGAQGTFTTTCGGISIFPWAEGFEGVSIPSFPSCWSKESGDYVTTDNANSTYDANAHGGTQFLREPFSATNEYMWTPGFSFIKGSTYTFSFWWAGDTYSGWTGDVFYNTSQISTGATQMGSSFLASGTTTTKTYAQATRTLVAPTSSIYYFAIRINQPSSSPWYLSFDDFGLAKLSPTITSQPSTSTQSPCQNGSSTQLSVSASLASGGSNLTYLWYSNNSASNSGGSSTGVTTSTFTPPTSSTGTKYYYCVVSNTVSGTVYTETSDVSGAVTVNANPTASPSFSSNPICSGSSTTLSANATAGSGAISSYGWSSGIAGNNASGSVSSSGTYTVTVTNSNSCTVAATSASLVVTPSLSGTYTVGSGGNYATLTAAITSYNSSCLGGAVVFNLTDATYSGLETFPITINANSDASATKTLTIKPASGVTATITGSVANNALIKFNGAKYVTIDGSNTGGADKNLAISNTSGTSPNVLLIGSSGVTAVNNITVKNCNITNGVNSSNAVVVSDATSIGSAGYFNNITIQNNNIMKALSAVYCVATVGAGNGSGLNVSNNTLNTTGANAIRNTGIYVEGVDGATVSYNSIGNFESSSNENDYGIKIATGTKNSTINGNDILTMSYSGSSSFAPTGIYIANATASSSLTISGNTISELTSSGSAITSGIYLTSATSGITISKNLIYNIKNSNNGGYGAIGIYLGSSSATAQTSVSNNIVYDIAGYGSTVADVLRNGYGIAVDLGVGYDLYFNTVDMTTNQSLVTSLPASIFVSSGITSGNAVNLQNNIFKNSQTSGNQRYAIYCDASSAVFNNINYNDYFTSGTNIGFLASARGDLTAWQSATSKDVNSKNVDPDFTSSSNLKPRAAALYKAGVNIPSITVDFNNNARINPPDVGALNIDPCTDAVGGTVSVTGASTFCDSGTPVITASGYSAAAGGTYQWQYSYNNFATPKTFVGQTNPATLTTGVVTQTTYYRLKVTCATGIATDYSNVVTITINSTPTASASSNSSICLNSALNLSASSDIGTNFSWSGPNGFTSNSQNPSIGSATAATAGDYTVTVTENGCFSTSSTTVVVNSSVQTPTAITITPGTEPTCQLTNGTTTTTYSTTAVNNTGFNWSLSDASAGSIGATTGIMTWANGYSGSVDIRVTASGCNGPTSTVSRTVNVGATVGTPTFALGATSSRCRAAGSVTYTATASNSTMSYSLDQPSLDAGNSINSSTGAVLYTAGWQGTSTITATADGCNGPKTANHTVTINPLMSYVSSTTTQAVTSNVIIGSTSQQIIGIEVVTANTCSPLTLTSFVVNANGTNTVVDISNAKIWYTGTSSSFATSSLYGTVVSPTIANFSVNGSQALATGTNYFWLTYDISETATAGHVVDATCQSIVISGNSNVPTVKSPAGTRTISSLCNAVSTFTGSGNWNNPANWDNGVPCATTNATINGSGLCTITASAVCKDLTINPAKELTVNSGQTLTVNGQFLILSTAIGTGSYINNGNVNYAFTPKVERYIPANIWHLISSPIQNAVSGTWLNFYLKDYNEGTNAFNQPMTPINIPLTVGKGYAVWSNSATTGSSRRTYIGNLNESDYPISLIWSGNGTHGWNLIGNMYTSAITADINNWTKTNVNNSIYVWNGGSYLTWNGTAGTLANGIIPASQGFLVQANGVGASVTIQKSKRVHNAQSFYKGFLYNNIVLRIYGNNYSDGLTVHFNNESTNNFDGEFDALKLYGLPEAPQISVLWNGNDLSINEIPEITEYTVMPILFNCSTSGLYTISAEGLSSFNSNLPIHFQDLVTGKLVNLREHSIYQFAYENNGVTSSHRFNLIFGLTPNGITENSGDLTIYAYNNKIIIENPTLIKLAQVSVYNSLGQLMILKNSPETMLKIEFDAMFVPGAYFVKTIDSSGKVIVKKVAIL